MKAPRPEVARHLATTLPGARVEPVAGDASTRSFWRVCAPDGESFVLMDYGAPFLGETDDVRLERIFREAGLRAAAIVAVHGPVGCLWLEDLGDVRLESAIAQADGGLRPEAGPLLESAAILAARVASNGTPVLARSERRNGPALDTERFRFEMDFFVEHYVVGLRHISPPEGLREALHALAARAAETPRRVLCHRDFHSRNLMVLPDRTLAMVDIQDARWGPDSYDLASLVRDAYVEIDEPRVEPLVERYLASLDAPPADGFRSRLQQVAAQRMLKALGTFGYQATVRGEPRYLAAVPRTLRRLEALLPSLPETRPLVALLAGAGLLEP